jgi:hypothetical protein
LDWRDEVTGEWRRLLNGEIYKLCRSPNEDIKMGRACDTHGYRRYTYRIVMGKPEGDHLKALGLVGIILKYISRKWDGETYSGLIWPRIVTGSWCL